MRQPVVTYNLGEFNANGASNAIFSKDFRNAIITITAKDSAALTLKVVASNSSEGPDFTQAASDTNTYTTTEIINMSTHDAVPGDTGVGFGGTNDGVTRYEINENLNNWIGIVIEGYTAGSAVVEIQLSNNQ